MSHVTVDFVVRLVGRIPFLEPTMREHLADNFGEVLPHVFFGDLTRLVVGDVSPTADASIAGAGAAEFRELLDALEEAFAAGPEEISELIAVSFLENLPRRSGDGDRLRDLLGPGLRAELERMG